MLKYFVFFVLACFAKAADTGDHYIVLETVGNEATKVSCIGMEVSAVKKAVTPASTFKILIAWTALEEGIVTPETKHLCADKYVPDTPRELTLHDALYYSSNDYFIWLASLLGEKKLGQYITKGQFGEIAADGWISPDLKGVQSGGKIRVSPEQQHRFIQKVAKGQLTSNVKVQGLLEESLAWPSSDEQVKLYGKTGTKDGSVWFNGFGKKKNGEVTSITIYVPYIPPNWEPARKKAIELFYSRFGQKPITPNM